MIARKDARGSAPLRTLPTTAPRFGRIAIVGAGVRARRLYIPAFLGASPYVRVVGVLDSDPTALAAAAENLPPNTATASRGLKGLLTRCSPDLVVVSGPDHTHVEYVVDALACDVDVLVEKPFVITPHQAGTVATAESRSQGRVYVAHNFRFLNAHREIREYVRSGALGDVMSLSLDYRLSPEHSGSYLERWHRSRFRSGGMEATKCSHHIDLMNFWLDDVPARAAVMGGRNHSLWRTAAALHKDADIDDTLSACLVYRSGALATYSLTPESVWEGYETTIRGTAGELLFRYEVRSAESQHVIRLRGAEITRERRLPREPGGHGGADQHMLNHLLYGDHDAEPFPGTPDGVAALALVTGFDRAGTGGTNTYG